MRACLAPTAARITAATPTTVAAMEHSVASIGMPGKWTWQFIRVHLRGHVGYPTLRVRVRFWSIVSLTINLLTSV